MRGGRASWPTTATTWRTPRELPGGRCAGTTVTTATPAWTFVARLFGAWLPVTNTTLVALGALDLILVGAMFALLFRTYGYRAACLSLAIFGLGYGWRRSIYIGSTAPPRLAGGGRDRHLSAETGRFAAAGACIGYAAMVRVFPVLLLTGPALLALKAYLRGERPRWPLRVAAGFGAVVCLAFAAGSVTGRGIEAWKEFGSHISVYRDAWSADMIGVDTLFLGGPANLLANLDGPAERRTVQGVRQDLADGGQRGSPSSEHCSDWPHWPCGERRWPRLPSWGWFRSSR